MYLELVLNVSKLVSFILIVFLLDFFFEVLETKSVINLLSAEYADW